MERMCLEVTDELHEFLMRSRLREDHCFDFFAADIDETNFEISFPMESPIRQLNNQKIERMIFYVVPFEDNTRIRVEIKSKDGRQIFSSLLGYEHGEKIFADKESVLEECIRLAWLPMPRQIPPLLKSSGECVVCFTECLVLEWPCCESHVTCEACIVKIMALNSRCPICRAVL